jgi:hypothetical protein
MIAPFADNPLMEPLIKSIMNRVADKNGILAATRYRETADCGSGEGASSPHRRFAYREPMSTARRPTPVAAATRYCVAADCGSSRLLPFPHRRLAHRVMAAVILAPTIRCGRAVRCESGGSDLSRTKGLRPTVSRSLCQGAQHRERPFLSQPEGHWLCGRSAACGCDTLLRSSRLREQPLATPSRTGRLRPPRRECCSLRRESPFASSPFLHVASPTRYRVAADCGRRGVGGIPAPEARAHRVMPPTPQSRMRGHAGLNQRFLYE